jgi:hypothetical protein
MRIFKMVQPSSITLQTLAAVPPLSLPDARAANPAGTARTQASTRTRLPNTAVGHRPGIPRTPRSRRLVRLAITTIPKITPTPGNRKNPAKTFQLNSLTIF